MSDPFYSDLERRAEIEERSARQRRERARAFDRLAPGEVLDSWGSRASHAARPRRRTLRELASRLFGRLGLAPSSST